jgi:hypothetical protein
MTNQYRHLLSPSGPLLAVLLAFLPNRCEKFCIISRFFPPPPCVLVYRYMKQPHGHTNPVFLTAFPVEKSPPTLCCHCPFGIVHSALTHQRESCLPCSGIGLHDHTLYEKLPECPFSTRNVYKNGKKSSQRLHSGILCHSGILFTRNVIIFI